MFIDFTGDVFYDFFGRFLYGFYDSLITLSTFLIEEFGLPLEEEFLTNAVANYGIVLYFLFFIFIGFLIYKLVVFLFNLFFVR